ncbi:MAG TPA: hypothetical protein VHB21_06880 [Minicystis sp.]|nr:hypothetical protein [Minicystis sp.]
MRRIEIEWVELGERVTATLSEDRNHALAELLWSRLPYASLQTHALVSGDHLYHVAPIVELVTTPATYKEDRTKSPDGTVFLSQLQHLAVKYGALSEYIPAAPVAHVVPEHLPALKRVGEGCWESVYRTKRPIEVRVHREGEPFDRPYFPSFGPVKAQVAQWLLDEIVTELQKTWLSSPAEIDALHAGRIPSGAGSRGQWFSTLVFVNGETRPLGYSGFGGLMQVCRDPAVPLDMLVRLTRHFIRVPAEFLGYCGLGRLWDFVGRLLDVLPLLETKDEYFALVSALGLYTNQLNAWNLHHYPWHVGGESFRFSPGASRAT